MYTKNIHTQCMVHGDLFIIARGTGKNILTTIANKQDLVNNIMECYRYNQIKFKITYFACHFANYFYMFLWFQTRYLCTSAYMNGIGQRHNLYRPCQLFLYITPLNGVSNKLQYTIGIGCEELSILSGSKVDLIWGL